MSKLKYTVIKDDNQYFKYCEILQEMAFSKNASAHQDEIDLLTVLIKEYDDRDSFFVKEKRDPVQVIKSLMEANQKTQQEIADLLNVSKGYVSEILNYKKRLSSDGIRILASHFAIQQEALNQFYELTRTGNTAKSTKKKVLSGAKQRHKAVSSGQYSSVRKTRKVMASTNAERVSGSRKNHK